MSCMLGFPAHLQFVIGSTLYIIWFQSCLLQILCNQVVINTFNLPSDKKSSAGWLFQAGWTVISNHIWWIMFFVHYLQWARNRKTRKCSCLVLLCMQHWCWVHLYSQQYILCTQSSWKEMEFGGGKVLYCPSEGMKYSQLLSGNIKGATTWICCAVNTNSELCYMFFAFAYWIGNPGV